MILAESENYLIYNEYEAAYLKDKRSGRTVQITQMYGDPAGAYISGHEEYCLVYGCGAAVYEPGSGRLSELLTDGVWFERMINAEVGNVTLSAEEGIYILDIREMKIHRAV